MSILDRHEVYVNGRAFGLNENAFRRVEHAIYPGTKNIMPIIDRDATVFEKYIWPHLVGYKLYLKETDRETLWRILSDAEYFRLPELREQVATILGSSALNPEELEAKVEEEVSRIKTAFTTMAKLAGAFLGPYFGLADFGDELISEIDGLDTEFKECAREAVELGSADFFDLGPRQKLIMALVMKAYLKIVSLMRQRQQEPPEPNQFYNFPDNPAPQPGVFANVPFHAGGPFVNDLPAGGGAGWGMWNMDFGNFVPMPPPQPEQQEQMPDN